MDQTRQTLEKLEHKAQNNKKDAKYIQALQTYQEIINIKKNMFGQYSQQYFETSYKICDICNLIAMIFLQKQKIELCYDFLKKAEILSKNSPSHKAATLNNLACYYRKTKKVRTAEQKLNQALELSLKSDQTVGLADTHLNLCAVLSQLGKYSQALEHVLTSVVLLQQEVLTNIENKKQRIPVLAIAYHNLGVQYQYLKRYQQAFMMYKKAIDFSEKYLGEEHRLVENFKGVLNSAEEEYEKIKTKNVQKREPKQQLIELKKLYQDKGLKRVQTAQNIKRKKGEVHIIHSKNQKTTNDKQSLGNLRANQQQKIE